MELRELLWHDFRLDLRLGPAPGGTTGAALLGVDPAGRRYAVKWSASPGVVLCEGARWAGHDGRWLTVVPWFDGPTALEATPSRAQWVAWGRGLAALHDRPVTGEVARLPREPGDVGPVVALFDRADRAVAGCVPSDGPTSRLVECWAAGRARLRAVRERALAPVRPAPAVPCHGDLHAGNVVLTGPGGVAFVDFDDAVLAPREKDLMFVLGGGVLPFRPVTGEQQLWFFEGYGPYRADPGLLAHFRCVRALEDVAEPAGRVLDRARSHAERAEALGYVVGALSRTGLVAQALAGP